MGPPTVAHFELARRRHSVLFARGSTDGTLTLGVLTLSASVREPGTSPSPWAAKPAGLVTRRPMGRRIARHRSARDTGYFSREISPRAPLRTPGRESRTACHHGRHVGNERRVRIFGNRSADHRRWTDTRDSPVAWRNGLGSSRGAAYRRRRSHDSGWRDRHSSDSWQLHTYVFTDCRKQPTRFYPTRTNNTRSASDSLCSRRGCGRCVQRPSADSQWLDRYPYVAWREAPPTSSPRRRLTGRVTFSGVLLPQSVIPA